MKRLIFAIICLTAITTMATVVYCPVKYGTATRIYFSLYDSNSPWQFYETAPAAGDTYIRKSGGAAARVTNAVTDLDHTMSLLLTSTEMEANTVTIDINDQDSPALFMSETIVIPTYGHASALDVNPVADANGHYPAQIEYISAGSNAFNTSTDTVLVSSTSKNAIVSAIDANATTLLAGSTAAVAVEGRIPTALSDEGYMLSEEPNVSSLMTTGVTLANGAQGGAAAVLTLDSIVVSNSDGVGVTITGTTDGVLVTGTAGDGAHFVSSGSNGNGLTLAGNGTGADLAADSVASPTDINDAMVHGDAEWGASGGFDPNATPIMLQAADQTKLGYLTDNVATAASLTAGVAQLDTAIADVNNTLGVAGAGLSAIPGMSTLSSGTAQSGTSSTIVLAAATASTVDFKGALIFITGGTGAGQYKMIAEYDGATDTATIFGNWAVTPGVDSTYVIWPTTYFMLDQIRAKR